MKKFFTYFFVSLGVVFFLILIGIGYLWFADPFELRPLIKALTTETTPLSTDVPVPVETSTTTEPTVTPNNNEAKPAAPAATLTPAQADALRLIGVEPEAVPSQFTEAEIKCFVGKFGTARVEEIKKGATPTPVELILGKDCLAL